MTAEARPHGIAEPKKEPPSVISIKIDAPWRVWRFFRARKFLRGKTYPETLAELVDLHAAQLDAEAVRIADDPAHVLPKV